MIGEWSASSRSTPAAGRAARRLVERAYGRVPVSAPARIRNAYHRRFHETDFDGYERPPDPFAVRWVDPDRIESFTGRPFPPYHGKVDDLGTVRDGDWDRRDEPPIVDDDYRARYDLYRADGFTESVFFGSLRAHFEDGVPWRKTPFVDRCLELAARGEPSWRGRTSASAILERCAYLDDLYERIEAEGYRSQRELGERSVLRVTDEVVVDVARDGTFLFVNGRHRLAIAKLLDLEEIPVGVLVRHADWMDARDSYARSGAVPDHPDLRDLRSAAGSERTGGP
ncbi:hypothetical protein ACFQGT_15620 [Natrialbaceae archaeon GCM10025810]|uniref:hypothetical protein n=1 Tax=Halovalidus salilacus TaxID=3075124 RepID=UPI0036088D58